MFDAAVVLVHRILAAGESTNNHPRPGRGALETDDHDDWDGVCRDASWTLGDRHGVGTRGGLALAIAGGRS